MRLLLTDLRGTSTSELGGVQTKRQSTDTADVAMESVHFRNGMLNKISNGIHPNYLDLGMMSNKEVSLTYLPFVRLDEQVRLGRGTMISSPSLTPCVGAVW
ncbi:hypothetical protein BLNAU_11101 [Blattamonas nauphoetae]|uniref:Uncharacterized protein n=1 Tax=Blattamonas nauphoetae TaxID=2049346 RepID=A0ABQ9XQY0_9EUKA|nr:hypothetical protein BLNAU_11101 [Blattamonas nauphoetae]